MTVDSKMHIDIEKEKKKNIKLAIGVAGLGIFAFFLLYIIIFAVMFLKPGLMFNLMPIPRISTDIVSIKDNLYVISEEIDFSNVSFADPSEPEEIFSIGILDGSKITAEEVIDPFYSIANDSNKIYFLSDGHYKVFDGKYWEYFETDTIGKKPIGTTSPEGLFVLSRIQNMPVLKLIKGIEVLQMPLPDEYTAENKRTCASSRHLLWFQDKLYLIWTSSGILYWAVYDGTGWSTTENPDYHGSIKVISNKDTIYLFHEQFYNNRQNITYTSYEDGAWLEPITLDLKDFFFEWNPVIYQDKPHMFIQSFFKEKLYSIENRDLVHQITISQSFFEKGFILKSITFSLLANLPLIIFIYLLSLFIGKFKLKQLKTDSGEYEFASLFRRFMAKFIDSTVIILPPLLLTIYFISNSEFGTNPFNYILVVFLSIAYIFIGGFLYHSLLEGLIGKTLGKKLFGIIVLKDDFSKCGLLAGFLRNIMRIVDSFFYYLVAIVSMTGTLKWQRLGDIVAGTVVLRKGKT